MDQRPHEFCGICTVAGKQKKPPSFRWGFFRLLSCALCNYAGEAASLEYSIFNMIGVAIEDTMIRKITDVKYTGVSRPAVNPFCATISATSPLVIIPTPIFNESRTLNLQTRAISPQPTIFEISPTATKAMEKTRMLMLTLSTFVFKPILAKKTGPNSM